MSQDWMDNLSPEARAQLQEAANGLQENRAFLNDQARTEALLREGEFEPPDDTPEGAVPQERGGNYGEVNPSAPPRTPNPDYSPNAPTAADPAPAERLGLELSADELQQIEDRKDEPAPYPTEEEMNARAEDYLASHPDEREAVMGRAEVDEPAANGPDHSEDWKQNLPPDVQAALASSKDQASSKDTMQPSEPAMDMDD